MKSIYDLRTNSMQNPIGTGPLPSFSWKTKSDEYGVMQSAYKIELSRTENFSDIIFDSGKINSDLSANVAYNGTPLKSSTRYYWRVCLWFGEEKILSESAYFETGLAKFPSNAEWIGNPVKTLNPSGVYEYKIGVRCMPIDNAPVGIAFSARDKDNYILLTADLSEKRVTVCEYCDNAWDGENARPCVTTLADADNPKIPLSADGEYTTIEITVLLHSLSVTVNGESVIDNAEVMPKNTHFKPQKGALYSWGFKQTDGAVMYKGASVSALSDGEWHVLKQYDFAENPRTVLGTSVDGAILVKNEFNIESPVPAINVFKTFDIRKTLKRARLYASARGFYEAYINGARVNTDFYNPGFTDYRKRIQYQTYDVTNFLKNGKNTLGAVVAKGYYTGHVGYNPPMIYGKNTSFIANLLIEYTDGTTQNIVTDGTWRFIDAGAVMDADFLHGERYDARLEFSMDNLSDENTAACGVYKYPRFADSSNGTVENEPFELSAQMGGAAKVERVLKPVAMTQIPSGHFVYDMGQNMVGTVRIRARGKKGMSIKLRYGEMCYKSGEIYIQNLRSAYNTDVYVFKGDKNGEMFMPTFTSHGFRYVEISGEGCALGSEDIENMIISVEGLVITNTREVTGGFECSNALVNKLQENIQWGQRGNSLLVFTDCPQRNERMGWTGDIQVFAKTAAYNMNVRAFTDKWLLDLRDAQLLYNRDGAVPDTAPLGGDNRADGCGGWGDAAVIVPWQMYLAYGDVRILEENYDMMVSWVDYQSRPDRQNRGLRTVCGKAVPEKSDLSSKPFLQVQQRRGDHLTFDPSTPYILSATAYAAHSADILAKTAEILKKTDDAQKYRTRFENIKEAFCEAWVCEDGSIAYWGEMSSVTPQGKIAYALDGSIPSETYYSDSADSLHHPSQTAYALALDFDLIPPKKRARAAFCYKRAIERSGGKLSVGFLGISHLESALTKTGLIDTAFSLLVQEQFPSWLYSVKNGATTIWERWNSYVAETDTFGDVSMNSFNHYSYGAIGEWLFSAVLGINTSEECGETGFKHIILTPHIGAPLTYARGYYDSIYGRIVSEWETEKNKCVYRCEIPPNTFARVYLPTDIADSVRALRAAESVEGECGVYDIGSGKYTFEFEI